MFAATACLATSAEAASVPMGTAGDFAVLAGSTITNTGPSVISGGLGLSPGTAITGFPPGTVSGGTIHAADSVATQAKADLDNAYGNAAARGSTAAISSDLAGRRLTTGVYTSGTSLGLSGDLTLDAQGDPEAVFVFQAGSTLTTGAGSRVLLIGGAQPCNVFWQVGSSATIGSSSTFRGNILALTSISLTTGATLDGRALARNGAVTLDTNRITRSTCAAPPAEPPAAVAPTATNTTATTDAGNPKTVVLHATDAEQAPLTYAITSEPAHGTLGPIDQATGTVVYTPAPGYSGPDSFSYKASSSNGTSNVAMADITVTPPAAVIITPVPPAPPAPTPPAPTPPAPTPPAPPAPAPAPSGPPAQPAPTPPPVRPAPNAPPVRPAPNAPPAPPAQPGAAAPTPAAGKPAPAPAPTPAVPAPLAGAGPAGPAPSAEARPFLAAPLPGHAQASPAAARPGGSAALVGRRHRLTGPFVARVAGRQIAWVKFYIDGRLMKTMKATGGRRPFSMRVNPTGRGIHRLTAKVGFTPASRIKVRTLRMVYQRTSAAAVRPRFAG